MCSWPREWTHGTVAAWGAPRPHQGATLKSLYSTPEGGTRDSLKAFRPEMTGSSTRAAPSASVRGAASAAWLPPGFIQETQPGSTAVAKIESRRSSPATVRISMFRPAFATFVCGCVLFFWSLGGEKDPSWLVTKTTKAAGAARSKGSQRAVSRYGTTRFTANTSASSGIDVSSSRWVQLVTARRSSCSPCASVRPGGNHSAFRTSASSSSGSRGKPAASGRSASAVSTKRFPSSALEAASASGSGPLSANCASSSSWRNNDSK
mmetsp:Transcript_82729/g.229621  ORF Transcript_82729/g.229621 Transcript_82729/m.229621 type:complete len:264 (-) Transcript_82729:502-1293(-)